MLFDDQNIFIITELWRILRKQCNNFEISTTDDSVPLQTAGTRMASTHILCERSSYEMLNMGEVQIIFSHF